MKNLPSVSFPCLKSVFIVKFSPLIFFFGSSSSRLAVCGRDFISPVVCISDLTQRIAKN